MKTKTMKFGAWLMAAALAFAGAGAYGETKTLDVSSIAAGGVLEISEAGTYKFPNLPNNITLKATVEGVVFDCKGSGSIASIPNGAKLEGLSFVFGSSSYHGWQGAGKMEFSHCAFDGLFFSYGDMIFTDCTFASPGTEYCMWCYAGNITYKGCTVNCQGKFANVYNEHNGSWKIVAEGCTFNSTKVNKAALNVKSTCGTGLKFDVTVNNCTVNENFPAASTSDSLIVFNGVVQLDDIKADAPNEITITQDGKVLYADNAVAGPEVVIEAPTKETVVEKTATEGDVSGEQKAAKADAVVAVIAKAAEEETLEVSKSGLSAAGKTADGKLADPLVTALKAAADEEKKAEITNETKVKKTIDVVFKGMTVEAGENVTTTKIAYDVTPKALATLADGTEVKAAIPNGTFGKINFRMPLTADFAGRWLKVSRTDDGSEYTVVGLYRAQKEGEVDYVQVDGDHFTTYVNEISDVTPVASIGGKGYLTLAEAFAAAVDGDTILFADGEHDATSKDFLNSFDGKRITLRGESQSGTIFNWGDGEKGNGINLLSADLVIENLTLKIDHGGISSGTQYDFIKNPKSIVYRDLIIMGAIASDSNALFEGCVFEGKWNDADDKDANKYIVWIYGGVATLKNCTFKHRGTNACYIKLYNDDAFYCGVNVIGCKFVESVAEGSKKCIVMSSNEQPKVSGVGNTIYDVWFDEQTEYPEDSTFVDVSGKGVSSVNAQKDENGKYTGGTFVSKTSDSATIKNVVSNGAAPGFIPVVDENGKIVVEPDPITGSGTEADPYVISDLKGLKTFRDRVDAGNTYGGKFVVLADDIDLGGENWNPIGDVNNQFKGSFDGQGHTISNLYIDGGCDKLHDVKVDTGKYVGLFAATDYGSVIKNLTIHNVELKGLWAQAGALVGGDGSNEATISGVNVTGLIKIGDDVNEYNDDSAANYVGGIIGKGYCTIDNCKVIGDNGSFIKSSNYYVGGIAGFLGEGVGKIISNCTVKNIHIAGWAPVGGVCGIAHYGNTIKDCTVAANVTVENYANIETEDRYFEINGLGGIAGITTSGADVTITGNTFAGKLMRDGVLLDSEAECLHNNGLVGVDRNATSAATINQENLKMANNTSTYTVFVAQIVSTGKKFDTLTDALAEAQDNDTVKLLKDIPLVMSRKFEVRAGLTMTLDLNGKVIAGGEDKQGGFAFFTNRGTLTIVDSSEEGTGKITSQVYPETSNYAGFYTVLNSGTLTLESGTIEETSGIVGGGANLKWALRNEAGSGLSAPVRLYIRGGKVISNYNALSNYVYDDNSECYVEISGGLLKSTGRFSVVTLQNAGASKPKFHVTITGGEFVTANEINTNEKGNATFYLDDSAAGDFTGVFEEISGGKFNTFKKELFADLDGSGTNDRHFLKGGLFVVQMPADEIAEGYVCAANDDAETTAEGYLWKVVPQQLTPTVDEDAEKPTYEAGFPEAKKEAEQTKEAIKEQTDNVKGTLTSPVVTSFTDTNVEKSLFNENGGVTEGYKAALVNSLEGQVPEADKAAVADAINTSADDSNSVGRVQIDLKEMAVGVAMVADSEDVKATLNKACYDVKPILVTEVKYTDASGNLQTKTVKTEITEALLAGSKVRFRLAVGKEFVGQAQVIHYRDEGRTEKVEDYYTAVLGEGDSKYVEIESDKFSPFDVLNANAVTLVCKVGDNMYATIADAITASADAYDTTIELLADIEPTVEVSGLGLRVIKTSGKAFNRSQITVAEEGFQTVTGKDGSMYVAKAKVDVPVGTEGNGVPIRGFAFPTDVTTTEAKAEYLAAVDAEAGNGNTRWQNYVLFGNEGMVTAPKLVPQIVKAAEGSSIVTIRARDGYVLNKPVRSGVGVKFQLMRSDASATTGYVLVGEAKDEPVFAVDVQTIGAKTYWKIQTIFETTEDLPTSAPAAAE